MVMSSPELIVEVKDSTLFLIINRPSKMNSITMEVLDAIHQELKRFENEHYVRSVVIRGSGNKAFSTGVDLSTMAEGATFYELHRARAALGGLFQYMWSYPKVIVAAVDGYALAGGFGLMAACDMVLATSRSKFGAPEINVGVWPFVITVPLLRYIAPRALFELMITGERIDANRALELGVINKVVSEEKFDGELFKVLATLNSKSGSITALGKSSFYKAMDMTSEQALSYLQSMLSIVTQTQDSKEGIMAFVEKRAASWNDN